MTVNDFLLLSPPQKGLLLIFEGDLPSSFNNTEQTFKLYFYKKFYFEEILNKSNNLVIETKAVRKFDEFKKYLSAIRFENHSDRI